MRGVTGAMLLLSLACSPAAGSAETGAAACSDGRDNDGDGLRDCFDPGCAEQPFCVGTPDAGPADARTVPPDGGPLPDRYAPPVMCTDPIDLVFVIDVSTSMRDEVDAIARGIDSIHAAATMLTPDVQLGLVVFVDDVVAVNDCAPFATVAQMQAELRTWQDFTSSNGQPAGGTSSNSDCPENSLDALYTAATVCPWRAGATRIVIHVTDDTFAERPARLSAGTFGAGIAVERTYAETVAALVAAQNRVGAFAAPGAGEECGAGSSPDVGRGFHAPYMGMESIPSATGGRPFDIRAVRAGTLDMAAAISELIAAEHCTLF